MPLPDAALAHYAAQQRQTEATVLLVSRLWRQVTGGNLDEEWRAIARKLTLTVAAAQLGAARAGAAYVPAVLSEIGRTVDPDAEVNPQAWSGVASDGRPLESLLFSPVVRTKDALTGGMSLRDALQSGGSLLNLIAATQVQDAGRGATSVAITARRQIGWTRVENTPCCQRCALLVGKWFKWNAGFLRHPHCSGRHVPCPREDQAELAQKISPDQIKDLTEAQRQAIDDGGNLYQVINAKRRASGMTTTEGTTRRGHYGGYERMPDGTLRRRAKGEKIPQRLTPDAIYRTSATREEALARLKTNGYLTDSPARSRATRAKPATPKPDDPFESLKRKAPQPGGPLSQPMLDSAATNPKFRDGTEYQVNCTSCVSTWEMRRRGFDMEALPLRGAVGRNAKEFLVPKWSRADGSPVEFSLVGGIRNLEATIKDWPDGARGIVQVGWSRGGGHVFSVEKIDGKARYFDPQSGTGDSETRVHFQRRIKKGRVWLVRMDDATPNRTVLQYMKEKA